jgi:transposase
LSRGDLTDSEWLILNPLLPDRGERGPAIANKRRTVNGMGSAHRRALARYAGTIRQLEFGLRALHTLEQAGRVGCSVRNAGESRSSRRQGTCHRFHDRAGAPTCSRRKRGNQAREALGRSRGGFSTKIHLRSRSPGGSDHIHNGLESKARWVEAARERNMQSSKH